MEKLNKLDGARLAECLPCPRYELVFVADAYLLQLSRHDDFTGVVFVQPARQNLLWEPEN